jgi:hypothetical protein
MMFNSNLYGDGMAGPSKITGIIEEATYEEMFLGGGFADPMDDWDMENDFFPDDTPMLPMLKSTLPLEAPVDNFWETGIETVDISTTSSETIDVIMYPQAKAKINALMEHYDHMEWLAYMTGEVIDGISHIKDIVIPEQRVTPVLVFDIKHVDVATIGVIHSHHDMGNTFSHTDDEYINQNHDISLCISKNGIKGHVRVRMDANKFVLIKANVKDWDGGYDLTGFIKDAEKLITIGRVQYEPVTFLGIDILNKVMEYHKYITSRDGRFVDSDFEEFSDISLIISHIKEMTDGGDCAEYDKLCVMFLDHFDDPMTDYSLESIELFDEIDSAGDSITDFELKSLNLLNVALTSILIQEDKKESVNG